MAPNTTFPAFALLAVPFAVPFGADDFACASAISISRFEYVCYEAPRVRAWQQITIWQTGPVISPDLWHGHWCPQTRLQNSELAMHWDE